MFGGTSLLTEAFFISTSHLPTLYHLKCPPQDHRRSLSITRPWPMYSRDSITEERGCTARCWLYFLLHGWLYAASRNYTWSLDLIFSLIQKDTCHGMLGTSILVKLWLQLWSTVRGRSCMALEHHHKQPLCLPQLKELSCLALLQETVE